MEQCLLLLGKSRIFHCRMKVLRGKLGKDITAWNFMLANSGGLKESWQKVGTLNSCALLVKVLDFKNGASHSVNSVICYFAVKKTDTFLLRTPKRCTEKFYKQQTCEKVCTRQSAEQGNHAVICSCYHLI